VPAPSNWRAGTAPTVRVSAPTNRSVFQPAPAMVQVPSLPTLTLAPAPQPVEKQAPAEVAGPIVDRPAVAQAPPATQAPASDEVTRKIIEIVAEKTGYPADMLDLDLDLEADLGIDTVKQAETIAAIRDTYDIPKNDNLSLRDYPTLGSAVGFVFEFRPDLKAASPSAPAPATASPQVVAAPETGAVENPVMTQILKIVADKTGYPEDMLDLDLDLEADLGIDTVKQAETFGAIRDAFDIPAQENMSLRDYPTLASTVEFVYQNRPELRAAAQPVPAQAAPQPAAPAPSGDTAAGDPVALKVLAVVAEKTGYPEDMLELDLDMEADLGIDTVKQAETFGAIREAFDIPGNDELNLRDYPTLASVIGFVKDHQPAAASAPAASSNEPAPPHTTARSDDPVTSKVLAIVAEKTGYPEDMLELDLDMEADLGIDTVKQAETIGAVRESFDIAFDQDLSLRDYPTLADVIRFVKERSDQPAPVQESEPQSSETAGTDLPEIKRREVHPMVRGEISWFESTGVEIGGGDRVVVAGDAGGVADALKAMIQDRGAQALELAPSLNHEELDATLSEWQEAGPIKGVYWLPALDEEPTIQAMDLALWKHHLNLRIKNFYRTMRALYDTVAGPGTFLVCGTRLGGQHGYGLDAAQACMGGAVSGFAKAYRVEQSMRDRGAPTVKVVDVEAQATAVDVAQSLLSETMTDPGVVEIGYHNGLRWAMSLVETDIQGLPSSQSLNEDTVYLVTGAAGGITSAIVSDLARNCGGHFYLMDIVDLPQGENPDIALFRKDPEALKRELAQRLRDAGERPTPVKIEKRIMEIERLEAALRAVESVREAGGKVHYASVNLLDPEAVYAAVQTIKQQHERIDVLIHAGGLLIDRTLPDKKPEQFDLVFDVKVDGLFSLFKAAEGMPIGTVVAFSSVAGRFGNNGQSDYSSANDLLCKFLSGFPKSGLAERGLAIDWTAWGEIGMASRGSVPVVMEQLGIDMLPPQIGIPVVRRELQAGTHGELVIAGRLGAWMTEPAENGGIDTKAVAAFLADHSDRFSMIGGVSSAGVYSGLEVEREVDPKQQPFLFDHQVEDGVPWLPGVQGSESMAQAANLLVPQYHVDAIEDVEILGAFKYFKNQPRKLFVNARLYAADKDRLRAVVELKSKLKPPKAGLPQQVKTHYRARVSLRPSGLETPKIDISKPRGKKNDLKPDQIYQVFFHGPSYQVVDRAQVNDQSVVAWLKPSLPSDTDPETVDHVTSPRLAELCFQAAGIWSIANKGAMALPAGYDRLRVYRPGRLPNDKLFALVETKDDGKQFDARVVDGDGLVYLELDGYRTVTMPGEVNFN